MAIYHFNYPNKDLPDMIRCNKLIRTTGNQNIPSYTDNKTKSFFEQQDKNIALSNNISFVYNLFLNVKWFRWL